MKKFEGIFTIIGVLVIVGMPLFLMFADFNASSSVLSDGYIRVLSYDDSITNTIDGNFEQTYSALDGTNFRDEVIYLYNDIEKEVSINDQIVSFNDEYIPLGITPLPEITETINKQPEVIPIPIVKEIIEPENEPIIDIGPVEIIEVKEEASSDENTDDLVMDEEIVIEDIVPEGVSELDELMPSSETFGDDIEDEIIEITEDVPEAASLGESEEIDSEEITEEESSSSAQSEESASPDEETFDDEEEEILTEEELEVVIENPIPEAIVPIEESFEETLEDEIIIEDEVPEGLLGLDGLEVSTSDDGNIHEARYVSYSVDEFGNEIGSLIIFSY